MSVHDTKRQLCYAFLALIAGFGLCLFSAPAHAQEAGDIVTYQTKRTAYRVAGWEKGLVKSSPNLGQFYWDPMTRYLQKSGSRRTGKGANINVPSGQHVSHYVRPKAAAMPINPNAGYAAASEASSRACVSANLRYQHAQGKLATASRGSSDDCYGVLSYGNNGDSAYGQSAGGGSRSQKLSVKAQLYGRGKN